MVSSAQLERNSAGHNLRLQLTLFKPLAHGLVGWKIHRGQDSSGSEVIICHSKARGLSSIVGLKGNTKQTVATFVLTSWGWQMVNCFHSD